jgi:hypothetical protein
MDAPEGKNIVFQSQQRYTRAREVLEGKITRWLTNASTQR